MSNKVLFLCTGNYYRSRFAEHLFNHRAGTQGLDWVADSRGLATELGVNNIGPISPPALARLREIAVTLPDNLRFPEQVTEQDLANATLIIALDRTEHAPYVAERLPAWVDRIVYWDVADLHALSAAEALGRIEAAVDALLAECAHKSLSCPPLR